MLKKYITWQLIQGVLNTFVNVWYFSILFRQSNPAEWVAFAGHAQSGSDSVNSPQIRQVERIITNSPADFEGFSPYEVALIKLSTPFELGASVKPICIAQKNPEHDQFCITAGWSTKSENGMI